jgi:hypothetical protein
MVCKGNMNFTGERKKGAAVQRKRAKRAIIASQKSRPFGSAQGRLLRAARPDPSRRKEGLLRMTINLKKKGGRPLARFPP